VDGGRRKVLAGGLALAIAGGLGNTARRCSCGSRNGALEILP